MRWKCSEQKLHLQNERERWYSNIEIHNVNNEKWLLYVRSGRDKQVKNDLFTSNTATFKLHVEKLEN
jgi:hypothetical protein